jgi:hypothetical protein
MQGLRWGELAGLQVRDRVMVPGPGLRLSRAALASNGAGELYVDTLKNKRARTVPLVPAVVPIVDRWSAGKSPGQWALAAPAGGPLRERTGIWMMIIARWRKVDVDSYRNRTDDLRITSRKQGVWVSPTTPPPLRRRPRWSGSVLPVGCQRGCQDHSQLGNTSLS